MASSDIAAAIRGARTYLTANPAEASYRDGAATAVIEDGLRIRVDGPDGATVTTDMVKGIGGGGSAPSPGWLFRASYAACIATLITMRAAESELELPGLVVVVDGESHDFGILGIDPSVPAGPLSMRIAVRVAAGRARTRSFARSSTGESPIVPSTMPCVEESRSRSRSTSAEPSGRFVAPDGSYPIDSPVE